MEGTLRPMAKEMPTEKPQARHGTSCGLEKRIKIRTLRCHLEVLGQMGLGQASAGNLTVIHKKLLSLETVDLDWSRDA